MGYGFIKIINKIYIKLFQLPPISIDNIAPPIKDTIHHVITDHINLPSIYRPQFQHDDLTPLLRIVNQLKPNKVLELGTGYGNTTANVCSISNAHIFTINALPEQLSGNIITYSLKKEDIGIVYRKYGYTERVTQLFENTLNFNHTKYPEISRIDFAIIDACHDMKYVINDFIKILPVLNEKATVLLHDTHPSMQNHLGASYKACMYLRSKGFNIKHIENTWWGIWQKSCPYISLRLKIIGRIFNKIKR